MSIDRLSSTGIQPILAPAERPQSQPQAPPPAADATRQIDEIAKRLESYLQSVSRSLEFSVDSDSGRTVISVRDGSTGELIRQIPNEEVLRLAQMAEDQTVVLVDEKA